jgi:exodeoxyribonuclease VII small subunit
MKKKPEDLTYEQAIERLEQIVSQIESGQAGLEDAIRLYEEGMMLAKRCREILAQAEQRIEQLSREDAGLEQGRTPEAR